MKIGIKPKMNNNDCKRGNDGDGDDDTSNSNNKPKDNK